MIREPEVKTIFGNSGPYLTRVTWGRLRLHVFHRGDEDPDCHDHPADFWTFPLVSYVEEYRAADGSLRERPVRAFRLHRRRAEFAHRVLRALHHDNGQILTIVWWGRSRRAWGFHTDDGWVPWRTYIAAAAEGADHA